MHSGSLGSTGSAGGSGSSSHKPTTISAVVSNPLASPPLTVTHHIATAAAASPPTSPPPINTNSSTAHSSTALPFSPTSANNKNSQPAPAAATTVTTTTESSAVIANEYLNKPTSSAAYNNQDTEDLFSITRPQQPGFAVNQQIVKINRTSSVKSASNAPHAIGNNNGTMNNNNNEKEKLAIVSPGQNYGTTGNTVNGGVSDNENTALCQTSSSMPSRARIGSDGNDSNGANNQNASSQREKKKTSVGYRLGKRKLLFEKRRQISDYALIFAMTGVMLMIIETELSMSRVYSKSSVYSILIKGLITCTTLILVSLILLYHALEVQVKISLDLLCVVSHVSNLKFSCL